MCVLKRYCTSERFNTYIATQPRCGSFFILATSFRAKKIDLYYVYMILLYFLTYKSRFPRQLLMIFFSLIDIYKNQTLTEKKKKLNKRKEKWCTRFCFFLYYKPYETFFYIARSWGPFVQLFRAVNLPARAVNFATPLKHPRQSRTERLDWLLFV